MLGEPQLVVYKYTVKVLFRGDDWITKEGEIVAPLHETDEQVVDRIYRVISHGYLNQIIGIYATRLELK